MVFPPEFLHQLGPGGIQWLVKLYTKTMKSGYIPKAWREVIVIAVLKLGKLTNEPGSYKPISLLCTTYKLLEHIILRRISPLTKSMILKNKWDSVLNTVAAAKFWTLQHTSRPDSRRNPRLMQPL